MDEINERIKKVCIDKFDTLTNASKKTGMNLNVLRSIVGVEKRIDGAQDPKYSHIVKIISSTKCNPMWLLFGTGGMYDDHQTNARVCVHDNTNIIYQEGSTQHTDVERIKFLESQVIELQQQVSTLVATNSILATSLSEATHR